jgi:predicted ArsR family transcriptional regulator
MLVTDRAIVDLLRRSDRLTVAQMALQLGVTATAIRQRLARLLASGDIERESAGQGRGRPSHRYRLTKQGQRAPGTNFADLAIALWDEVRSVRDLEIRRGLLQRISARLVSQYAPRLEGKGRDERLQAIVDLFAERNVPLAVDQRQPQLPVLNALACPYPDLAEHDRSVCSMERMMFSELLGESLSLSQCRLDGATCCSFTPAIAGAAGETALV